MVESSRDRDRGTKSTLGTVQRHKTGPSDTHLHLLQTMADPVLEYLSTILLTHAYLGLPDADIPVLHNTVAAYTESPRISKKYPAAAVPEGPVPCDTYIPLALPGKRAAGLTDEIRIRLYILQLRLEIIMSEFRLATGTISRLKDLFAQLGVQEEVGALTLVITLRAELLEAEAFLQETVPEDEEEEEEEEEENDIGKAGKEKEQGNELKQRKKKKKKGKSKASGEKEKEKEKKRTRSPFDHLAIVKNAVTSYIDKSAEVVISSVNRSAALSVTSSGADSMRAADDLFALHKRKAGLDKNIADLAKGISVDKENKIMINPAIVANESIEALSELLKMRPLDAETYIELSHVYLSNGKIKEALWCVGECLIIGCSGAWNVWSYRAELCMLQGKCIAAENGDAASVRSWLYSAIASFAHSIELCSGYVRAWCGLYVSLQKLDDLKIEVDPIYPKMKFITLTQIKVMLDDVSIPVKERENIHWILNNY